MPVRRSLGSLAVPGRVAILIATVVASTLLSPVTDAHAVIAKSGSQSCAAGLYVELVGKGQGDLNFYTPSGTFRYIEYHSTVSTGYYRSSLRSATWKVTSDDILVDAGTYATCVAGAAQANILRSRSRASAMR